MDEYLNRDEEKKNLTPEEQAAQAIEEAKHRAAIAAAAEQWEREMQRRAAEQKAAEDYRRMQEEQAARIKAENEAREEAARRQKETRKARRKKGLRVTAIVMAVVLLVGGAGYAAGNIAKTISGLKKQVESLENQKPTQSPETPTQIVREKPTANTKETAAKRESNPDVASGTAIDAKIGGLTDVSDIVDEALPSVVSIVVTQLVTSSSIWGGSRQYETSGAGSGIVIGQNEEELWIVTNYHVVEGATAVSVQFCDETKVDVYVKGTNKTHDLAVLGVKLENVPVETLKAIKIITIGESDTLRLGQGVIAIGNAMGWGQSVTTGVVSALNREVQFSDGSVMYLLQTSAAINPGNSGGALLNANGELVGINNAKYSDTSVEGVGFAIPISSVKSVMEELSLMKPREKVSEEDFPYLGVTFKDLSTSYMEAYGMPTGAYIYEVGPGTPAEKAGVLNYDIVTKLGSADIINYDSLMNELQYYKGGTAVNLTVMRLERGKYVEKNLTITLGFKKDYN